MAVTPEPDRPKGGLTRWDIASVAGAVVVRAWPVSRLAALLLVPYALWVAFATALTWVIWARN